MATTRFINTSGNSGKRSAASEIIRLELQKKGKLPPSERFKFIMKKKMEENRAALNTVKKPGFGLPGSIKEARQLSKRGEAALKEMAAKKAAKENKRLRQMVIVQPRNYPVGSLNKKGQIYDIAGNMIGKVDSKTGKMSTSTGWSLGKYKPKSYMTDMAIQDAINKYSPYYINLRKMQAMQQGAGGVWGAPGDDVINVHGSHAAMLGAGYQAPGAGNFSMGSAYGYGSEGEGMFSGYGSDVSGPRQNVGATSWGARSDNVWGTYSDNAWGNSMDNVWGGNSSDVWGGIGGNPWGSSKAVRIWGSGNGANHLAKLAVHVAAFFGLGIKSKNSRSVHEAAVTRVRTNRSSRSSGSTHNAPSITTRSGGGKH